MTSDDRSGSVGLPSGFAGLSASVSDIEADVAPFSGPAAAPTPKREPVGGSISQEPGMGDPDEKDRKSSGRFGLVVTVGFVVIVVALLMWSASRHDGETVAAASPDDTSYTDNLVTGGLPGEPVQPEGPAQLVEEMPPIGAGQLLQPDQIRYCLAEGIRIDAADIMVNNSEELQVGRFNAMVRDYNSRCSEFRYSTGAMADARSDVEAHRAELEQAGRARIAIVPATDTDNEVNSNDATPAFVFPTTDRSIPRVGSQTTQTGNVAGGDFATPTAEPAPQPADPLARTWSGISAADRAAAEAACTAEKSIGPYTYNKCLMDQISGSGR